MTQDQIDYYNDLEETFGTNGWKRLVEEATAEIYQLQADALDIQPVPGVSTDFILGKLQGRAEQLAYLVRLQEVSEWQRHQLEVDSEDDEAIYVV